MRQFLFILLTTISTTLFAAGGFGKNPYHSDPHPFRLYYFGYNVTSPGFGLGPEFNLSWTKMERSKCTHGVRVSDRQLVLAPQLGMFMNESNSMSVFGNLELSYKLTFNSGMVFELFGAGGYAQMLESPESVPSGSADPSSGHKSVEPEAATEATSGFMPEAGLGLGYNFQKMNGKDFPLTINFRGMATSVGAPSLSALSPALTAGITYDF